MNLKEIKELIDAVSQHGITELEIERAGVRVRIRKDSNPVILSSPAPVSSQAVAPIGAGLLSVENATVPQVGPPSAEEEDLYIVRAPIVGTFYRAPNPNAEPFVTIGDSIEPG